MENKKTMKAAVIHEYGDYNVFNHEDVAIPEPTNDEVLVRVHYTSVNPYDCKVRSGSMKERVPIKFPAILGTDIVGTVEKTGSDASKFKNGDLVFGKANFGSNGSYAEYALAEEINIAHAPRNMPENEIAGLPVVAGTAWSVLFDIADLKPGQKLLITGASGGIGTMAIQIAKSIGAYVIGTTSNANIQMLKDIGADEVIDYTDGDYSEKADNIDVILDTVGGETLEKAYKMVKKEGLLFSLIGPINNSLSEKFGIRAQYVSVPCDGKTMGEIAKLVDAGKLRVLLDSEVPLEKINEAHARSESRKARGKIIIKI